MTVLLVLLMIGLALALANFFLARSMGRAVEGPVARDGPQVPPAPAAWRGPCRRRS